MRTKVELQRWRQAQRDGAVGWNRMRRVQMQGEQQIVVAVGIMAVETNSKMATMRVTEGSSVLASL